MFDNCEKTDEKINQLVKIEDNLLLAYLFMMRQFLILTLSATLIILEWWNRVDEGALCYLKLITNYTSIVNVSFK